MWPLFILWSCQYWCISISQPAEGGRATVQYRHMPSEENHQFCLYILSVNDHKLEWQSWIRLLLRSTVYGTPSLHWQMLFIRLYLITLHMCSLLRETDTKSVWKIDTMFSGFFYFIFFIFCILCMQYKIYQNQNIW